MLYSSGELYLPVLLFSGVMSLSPYRYGVVYWRRSPDALWDR